MASLAYTNAVIFIHGLGDSGRGWSFLERMMPDFPNRKVVYAFPDAPSQPVSCNNGMVMPSWFDIKAIPVNDNEPDDPAGIDESIASIHGLIDKVIADNNLKPENVVLGGFSQGGAMSLMAGSTYHAQLGGVVCLSGWLLRKSSNVAAWSGPKASVPLFIGHGDADQVVLTSLGKEAADRIKAERDSSAGSAGVTFKTYAGEGHGACDDELKDLAQFFNEVLK
ncbi:hypothetical protein TrVE_jg8076 [Triparma verrucosa]|uniref:Phospholipase/carboxylesterase/thioesterase domain-containing protein n=1 Tax=Triparma verrucosa TaxID=1606542 RepID=A0A9W7BLR0_9STRA|nr:hypothetical protein TrVE_jg8076 [Triparma verrucosa]